MRRTRYAVRGIELHPYPVMLFVGMTAGVMAGTAVAGTHALSAPRAQAAMLLLLAPAIAGARLLFVARHWEAFRASPTRIWRRGDGGLALYGGFALALLASVPLLRALRLPLAAFWDVGAIAILVGLACTKVGCHLNGCCAGRLTTHWLALPLPGERGEVARRIPAQLLESAFAAALAALALGLHDRLPFDGALFLGAVMAYGAGRLALESTRERVDRAGRVGVNHVISAALAGAAALAMVAAWIAR